MNVEQLQSNLKEIIEERFPVYNEEITITNEAQAEALFRYLLENYERIIDQFMAETKERLIAYIEKESPHREQSKRKSQNDYVLNLFRSKLLKGKRPDEDTLYSCLWSYKQYTRDTGNYYD